MKERFTSQKATPWGGLPGISRILSRVLLLTVMVAGLAMLTGRTWGQTITTVQFDTPGFYNFPIPAGATVTVTVWGAGASGGCGTVAQGGGGGGAVAQSSFDTGTSGGVVTLYVGRGGRFGVDPAENLEEDGEDSYFDPGGPLLVLADGGKTTTGAAGGSGGLASASTGNIKNDGGNGGAAGGTAGGGGGGSGLLTGAGSAGVDGSGTTGGTGGAGQASGGRGGNDADTQRAGVSGGAPGGGGGGEADNEGTDDAHPPGLGGNGLVIVQYSTLLPCEDAWIVSNPGSQITQVICEDGAIAPISFTIGGGAQGAIENGLPAGLDFEVTYPVAIITQTGPLGVGTYTYTITTTGSDPCEEATITGTITVNETPDVTITAPGICEGGTTTANSSVIGGFWGSSNTGTATVDPITGVITGISAGTVSITFYTFDNCYASADLTVYPAATITLTTGNDNQVVCLGTDINGIQYAMGGGADTPTASFDDGGIGLSFSVVGTTAIVGGFPTASGTYTITVDAIDAPCGPVSISGNVTVDPPATLTLTSEASTWSQTVCEDFTITPIQYTYGGGASSATVTGLPDDVAFTLDTDAKTVLIYGSVYDPGVYSFTVTTDDPAGPCPAVSLVGYLTVSEAATISLTSGTTPTGYPSDQQHICLGEDIYTITYYVDGSIKPSDPGDGVKVDGLAPTMFYTFVSNASPSTGYTLTIYGSTVTDVAYTITTIGAESPCPEVTATGTITIHTPGQLALSSAAGTDNQEFCYGESLTDITYEIGGGATGAVVDGLPAGVTADVSGLVVTISGTPSAAGVSTYTVTTTGATPCLEAQMTGTITVNPLPEVTAGSNSPVCEGSTLQLTCTVTSTTATATLEFEWVGPKGALSDAQNVSISPVGLDDAGTYTVTVTDENGCSNFATTEVVVNALPDVNASSNSAVCEGSTLTLFAESTVTITTWSWEGPNSFSSTLQNPSVDNVTLAANGTYTVTVTDENNCSNVATTDVVVNKLPEVTISGPTTVCSSSVEVYSTEGGMSTYTWTVDGEITYSGDGTEEITVTWGPAGTGTVTVNYYDLNGCTAAAPAVMPITIIPEATITLTSDPGTDNQTICLGQDIVSITYTVDGGATGAVVDGLTPGLNYEVTGTYDVVIYGTTDVDVLYTIRTLGATSPCPNVSATGTITVNMPPTVELASANDGQVVCAGSAIVDMTYTVGGDFGDVELLDGGTGLTGTLSGTTFTVSGIPTASGTFTVTTVLSDPCDEAWVTGSVTVNPPATLTLTSANDNQEVCIGNGIAPIHYTFGGGASTASVEFCADLAGLTGTVSGTELIITGAPVEPTPEGTHTYTVTTNDPDGPCPAVSLTGQVTVRLAAELTLDSDNADQIVCEDFAIEPIVYTFGYGATGAAVVFDPAQPDLLGTVSGTQFIISGVPTGSGTFTVTTTGTDAPCLEAYLTGSITVTPAATISLTSYTGSDHQHICLGDDIDPIVYDVDGSIRPSDPGDGVNVEGLEPGLSYTFLSNPDPSTGYTLTIFGSTTTNVLYTITTIGADYPCDEVSVTGTITVHTPGTLALTSAAGSDAQSICIGDPIGTISYTVGGGATSAVVSALPAGLTSSVVGTLVTISGTPLAAGTITYTVTTTGASPCLEATMSGMITVNPLPVVTASSTSPVCVGSTLTLLGGPSGTYSYSWVGPGTFSSTEQNPVIPNVTLAAAGTYTLTVTNTLTKCVNSAATTVVVNPLPDVTASSNSPVCEGSTLNLAAASTVTITSWSWVGPNSFSSTIQNPVIAAAPMAAAGTYTVTVTDLHGCVNSASTVVTVNALPTVTVTGTTTVCALDDQYVYTTEAGMSNYVWNVEHGTVVSGGTATSSTVTVVWGVYDWGKVSVNYTDVHGCTATQPTVLDVDINLPSTITLTSGITPDGEESDKQFICLGENIYPITYLVDLGATGLDVIGLEPGLTFDIETTQAGIVVSITGTTDTDVHYMITTDGSLGPCNEKLAEGWITVNLKPELVMCAKDTVITTSAIKAGDCIAELTLTEGVDFDFSGRPAPVITYYLDYENGTLTETGNWTDAMEFETGITKVTLIATNSCGVATCTFTVEVVDDEDPYISCVGNQQEVTDPGKDSYTKLGTGWDAGAYDNCGSLTPTITFVLSGATTGSGTTLSGTEFEVGTTHVVWTVKDESDSTATCSYDVVVLDNQAPVIECALQDTTVSMDPGKCYYTVKGTEFDLKKATDNDGIVWWGYSLDDGATWVSDDEPLSLAGKKLPAGLNKVWWKVKDTRPNIAECEMLITVADNEKPKFSKCGETFCVTLKPTIVRNRFGVFISATGYLYDSQIRPWLSDNSTSCSVPGVITWWLSRTTTFTDADAGANLVQIYFKDGAGNMDSCCIIVDVPLPFEKSGNIGNNNVESDVYSDLNMTVYPNPTKGKLYLDIQNLNDPKVVAKVFNATGSLVLNKEFTTDGRIELDLNGNVSGMYMLQVTADKKQFTHKIILE